MLKWTWLSAVVIVLDQITKYMASTMLLMYKPVAIFPMFNFTLMHNTGAAFSFLDDAGGWQRWFFTVIALAVSTFLIVWIKRLTAKEKLQAIALALILGGAIGNVIDRIWLGYVVDFIDVYYQQWRWPAFNIADSAISIGAVLIIIDTIKAARSTDNHKTDRA
ncbi:MAG: signal peptidase II [Gammaproteobacteria bacterium]|nr:signal peptidase II [Gammaproteobacteria bacterium]MDH5777648.1 signal peptidase II [Gammaproteobacteria bacterium]